MADLSDEQTIWVNTTEAAEITGYNAEHVRKLARDNWKLAEDKQIIRVRFRSNRYDIWLPDLLSYINEKGYGPHRKSETD
jgi:hypothetical protein